MLFPCLAGRQDPPGKDHQRSESGGHGIDRHRDGVSKVRWAVGVWRIGAPHRPSEDDGGSGGVAQVGEVGAVLQRRGPVGHDHSRQPPIFRGLDRRAGDAVNVLGTQRPARTKRKLFSFELHIWQGTAPANEIDEVGAGQLRCAPIRLLTGRNRPP